jgi:hypothetical protein
MANPHIKLVTPTGKIPTVRTPRRRPNTELRTREHLTEREVERLIEVASSHRDATMILLAFRHGLRAAELVDLRWDQVAGLPRPQGHPAYRARHRVVAGAVQGAVEGLSAAVSCADSVESLIATSRVVVCSRGFAGVQPCPPSA